MKRVIVEYHIETGAIGIVRTFDSSDIPLQPCRPGYAILHVDRDQEPDLAEKIQFHARKYRVNHVTKDFEEKG